MPLTAKIDNAIPQQNCELILLQLGAILLVEFTNQGTNYSLPAVCTPKRVNIEGFLQIDESLLPEISIRLVSANEVQKDSSGDAVYEYCYYIDFYTGSPSTIEDSGDQQATYAL